MRDVCACAREKERVSERESARARERERARVRHDGRGPWTDELRCMERLAVALVRVVALRVAWGTDRSSHDGRCDAMLGYPHPPSSQRAAGQRGRRGNGGDDETRDVGIVPLL